MTEASLLGLEIGTGEPVYLPFHHAGFTGMTGKAGKSTAIEGVGQRSGFRVIAFLTKRGEQAFRKAKRIPLFYKERSDWRYVESLLVAELREDKRFERAWVIKVCRGTKGSLRAVWDNVKEAKKKARKDSLSERVYTCLDAYFEIIVPELEKYDFSNTLELGNESITYVMDLIGMSESTQAVIMRSALEYINKHEKGVINTVPEAWKFVGLKGTPVLDIAERIVKQGFAVKNFLWVDSQDIASINPKIRGQIDNWVLGRQRYEHEIKRTLDFIPVKDKPSVEQIQTLKLGHFFVACEDWVKEVYALPYGVPEDEGIAVALGKKTPEEIRDKYLKPKPFGKLQSEPFDKIVEDNVRLQDELKDVYEELSTLKETFTELTHKYHHARAQVKETRKLMNDVETLHAQLNELAPIKPLANAMGGLIQHEIAKHLEDYKTFGPDVEAFLKDKIEEIFEHPNQFNIKVKAKQTSLVVEKPLHPLVLSTESHQGMIAVLYADGKLPKDWFTTKAVMDLYMARGMKRNPRTIEYLKDMCKWGFLESRVQGKKAREFRVLLPPNEAEKKGLLLIKDVKP